MKKYILIIGGVVVLGLIGFGVYSMFGGEGSIIPVKEDPRPLTVYANPKFSLSFTYRTGPEGYMLEEISPLKNAIGLAHTIILTPSKDYSEAGTEAGKEPPTIMVQVFKNLKKRDPRVWVRESGMYGTQKNPTQPQDVVVQGASDAIKYTADGLYKSDMVIATHQDYVYVFTGMYKDTRSALHTDFAPLIASVQFLTTRPGEATKINIQAVCDGALAYKTFPNDAAVDTFIKDCVAGKHPEVIEKYKKDNGLTGATI